LDDARRPASFPSRVLRRRRPAEGWCPRSESTRPKPGPLCPRPEPAACPSWGCSASQRIHVPVVGTYWFGPALHVLGPEGLDLEVSRPEPRRQNGEVQTPAAPRLPLPSRDGPCGPANGRSQRLPSWGSVPFDASVPERSGPRGLPTPATFRLQGFSPSCRIAPSRAVWACFIPQTPMGFFPSGPSPSVRGDRLLTGPFPSCRCRGPPKRALVDSRGLHPGGGPLPPGPVLPIAGGPMPSWAFTLPRVRPARQWGRLPVPSPHVLPARRPGTPGFHYAERLPVGPKASGRPSRGLRPPSTEVSGSA
jgi:hypothetical protein